MNQRGRGIRRISIAAGALAGCLSLLLWHSTASAFATYSADPVANTGNCATCHGDFNGGNYTSLTNFGAPNNSDAVAWGANLMNGHVTRYGLGCTDCHSTIGAAPVSTNASMSGITCSSCHGREQDKGTGALQSGSAGLRQHHYTAGVMVCAGCHAADSNPATFTPVGEDVAPVTFTAKGIDPCDESAYGTTKFGVWGLDNDGDGLRDGNDPNCQAANQPPTADPNGPYSGQAGQVITFDGSGSTDPDGTIASYAWTFGDGATGSGVSPTHSYAADGTYTVSLTVTDNAGATHSASTTATITTTGNLPPTANPNGPYTGTVGASITFNGSGSSDPDGTIASYAWNFGDGATGTGVSPTHSYSAAGTYTVSLTVTDNDGATNTASTTATITSTGNQPPVADPNGPYTGNVGMSITFDGSGSSDPDGTIASYAWTFGDGATGSGVSPTHSYAADGTYTVSLTVTDNAGATHSASTTATITTTGNLPPTANPNGPYTGTVGASITFNGSGSSDPDGTIASYAWNFGDGATGTGVSPTHSYSAAGTYTVSLTVTDNDGATNTASTTATITSTGNQPPVADPNGPYTGNVGMSITFDGSGSSDPDGTIASYAWNFGDGATGTGVSPTHSYSAAGTYNVSLTVTDNNGATHAATTTATISGATPTPTPGPLTKKELLGKALFFDTNLSTPKGQSCAVCHGPEVGWTGPDEHINAHGAVYEGAVKKRFGNRKPPSSAYATPSPLFHLMGSDFMGGLFWDGRATGERLGSPAADQALGPFLNPLEQANPNEKVLCMRVKQSNFAKKLTGHSYDRLFDHVFGPGSLDCSKTGVIATYERIGLAIAAYEGSSEVNQYSSKFDAYLAGNATLTAQEQLGMQLFNGKALCSACHTSTAGPNGEPPLFTDFKYHNLGVPKNPENPFYDALKRYNPDGKNWIDPGLGGFLATRTEWASMAAMNHGKHKTPTLRNVDLRPKPVFVKAFMHNGVFKSLKEVVHFYNTRDVGTWAPPEVGQNLSSLLGNLGLTGAEEDAIVAFMMTLNDTRPVMVPRMPKDRHGHDDSDDDYDDHDSGDDDKGRRDKDKLR